MKLFNIILGVVTLAGVGMTAPAEARTHFSIGLGLGFFGAPRYVERVYVPAPVYVAPAPVYEEVYYPAPRYYREVREVYVAPRPCYYHPYYPY